VPWPRSIPGPIMSRLCSLPGSGGVETASTVLDPSDSAERGSAGNEQAMLSHAERCHTVSSHTTPCVPWAASENSRASPRPPPGVMLQIPEDPAGARSGRPGRPFPSLPPPPTPPRLPNMTRQNPCRRLPKQIPMGPPAVDLLSFEEPAHLLDSQRRLLQIPGQLLRRDHHLRRRRLRLPRRRCQRRRIGLRGRPRPLRDGRTSRAQPLGDAPIDPSVDLTGELIGHARSNPNVKLFGEPLVEVGVQPGREVLIGPCISPGEEPSVELLFHEVICPGVEIGVQQVLQINLG